MNYPWGHNRRFNAYSNYFKNLFGKRIQKVSINAGFTCPNRDGSISTGGCTFCNNEAFNPSYCESSKSVAQQIGEGIAFHEKRYGNVAGYLAYFQAYSNSYASLEKLKELYEEALVHHKVIGLVIGTRPDCMDEEKLSYISYLSKRKYMVVEYGVESCYNKTLERVNRGHSFEESERMIHLTAEKGIHTGAHFIMGLPGETREMMLHTAGIISRMPMETVKFHQLQIMKNTPMAEEYVKNPGEFHLFGLEDYVDFFVDFLERLSPRLIIERFAGEAPPRHLVNQVWKVRNYELINMLEKRLEERGTCQGKFYKE